METIMGKNYLLLFIVLIFAVIFLMVVSACSTSGITGGQTEGSSIAFAIGPVIVGNINSQDYLLAAVSFDSPYIAPDILILDLKNPEKPVIKAYEDGAILKLSCRLVEGKGGMDPLVSYLGSQFDALFLAPDPSKYIEP
jgi:hypothetical protein